METLPRIAVLTIGEGEHPVAIIDGLSEHPNRWRAEAAAADYHPRGDFYPGRRAPVGRDYLAEVAPLLGAVIRRVFGCTEHMSVDRALYSIVSKPPAELALAQRIPHVDDTAIDRFAMVHYLSHEDFGGTAFYRHRATGLEAITPDRHAAYLVRLEREFAAGGLPPAGYIAGDTAQFARIFEVPHRFNRAIVYPSNLLHCSATGERPIGGDDALAGRLTVAAFMTAR
jgi:hypothetical protein